MLCIILVSPCYCWSRQTFDMLEFYAGKGNLSRVMKLSGWRTGSLDIKYGARLKRPHNSNPMDILSPSGFAPLEHHWSAFVLDSLIPFWCIIHVIYIHLCF